MRAVRNHRVPEGFGETPVLSPSELKSIIQDQLMPEYDRESIRLKRIDNWYRWEPENFRLPRKATSEHRALRDMSKAPWLSQVVTATAQCMFVDGYRSQLDEPDPDSEADYDMTKGPYGIWLANGWDDRQIAVHRAMLAYGYAYAICLPGEDPTTGESMPIMRGVSPRKMVALYEDPAEDDWPEFAMRVDYVKGSIKNVRVYDDTYEYTVVLDSSTRPDGSDGFTVIDIKRHDSGVVPVVRYCKELDLDGRTKGEVEPYIALAQKINKTSYDRMLVQHWNSWKIRWIAGLSEPDTEEGAIRAKLKLAQDDFLIAADADTKFGTLAETGMGGFIDGHRDDIETLAAVSQTPTHELTGQMVNLSAEALAAARASQSQKVHEIQKPTGRSHNQLLKLACKQSKRPELLKYVKDITGRVTWQDTSVQSLSAAVDALGKAATLLGIPEEVLWARIPGVEKPDVMEWIKLAKQKRDELYAQQKLIADATAGMQMAGPAVPGAPAPTTPAGQAAKQTPKGVTQAPKQPAIAKPPAPPKPAPPKK